MPRAAHWGKAGLKSTIWVKKALSEYTYTRTVDDTENPALWKQMLKTYIFFYVKKIQIFLQGFENKSFAKFFETSFFYLLRCILEILRGNLLSKKKISTRYTGPNAKVRDTYTKCLDVYQVHILLKKENKFGQLFSKCWLTFKFIW